jgi:DNA-binding CsgD family transcriptional regulator
MRIGDYGCDRDYDFGFPLIQPEKSGTAMETCTSTSKLTAAEKRVLALVSLGNTNKEIAAKLNISPATVKRHLENVLRKAHLKNRVEAAIYGLVANGCPHASKRNCLLTLWQRKNGSGRIWAI